MSIRENEKNRKIDIIRAPEGAYYVKNGIALFPKFVAFYKLTPAEVEHYGVSDIYAPVESFDGINLKLSPCAISTYLDFPVFKQILDKAQRVDKLASLRSHVRDALYGFYLNNTKISEDVKAFEHSVEEGLKYGY